MIESLTRAAWQLGVASLFAIAVFADARGADDMTAVKSVDDYKAEAAAAVDAITVDEALRLAEDDAVIFIDVREGDELERLGKISKAEHVPRGVLEFFIDPNSSMHMDLFSTDKTLVFYCATGGRSMLAAKRALDMGVKDPVYLEGGFTAWREADGPVAE